MAESCVKIENKNDSENRNDLHEKLCDEYRENQENKANSDKGLNPMLLGINAMIAEHLHRQKYHLTLKVFQSEVQFPETLPQFKDNKDFRFKESDVKEVLEAMDVPKTTKKSNSIFKMYFGNLNFSLLTIILTMTLKKDDLAKETKKDLSLFNNYLQILVKRIARITFILNELRHKRAETKFVNPSKRRESKKLKELVQVVEKLNKKLSISVDKIQNRNLKNDQTKHKSYNEWLTELKESKQGRKLIRRIEKVLLKALEKERESCQKNCNEKIENQKLILKLHYKQKFLEHYQACNLNIDNKQQEMKPEKEIVQPEIVEKSSLNKPKPFPKNSDQKLIDLKNVEDMIKDAKTRLKVLEEEGEKLDKSFTNYLQRQVDEKRTLKKNMSEIWKTYHDDRNILQRKIDENVKTDNCDQVKVSDCEKKQIVSKTNSKCSEKSSKMSTKESEFENPFINFNVKRYLESTLNSQTS